MDEEWMKVATKTFAKEFDFPRDLARNIAEGIETYAEGNKPAFRRKFVSLMSNLHHKVNGERLVAGLQSGEIDPKRLAFLSAEQLYPELWEQRRKEQEKRDVSKLGVSMKLRKEEMIASGYEGVLQCGRCKSRLTEYIGKQTRSADEPETQFATCYNCGNRWKQ
jgi:DNA-directed RNA polymerase subunit M/transcription elongation factor TFIIS